MIETVFVITMTFTDWDDCWNYWHDHTEKLVAHADPGTDVCNKVSTWVELAPRRSPRPKSRP